MRQENERTSFLALFSGLLFVAAIGGIFILSSFINKPTVLVTPTVIDEPIIVVDYFVPPKETPIIHNPTAPLPQTPKVPKLFIPIIVKPIEATDPVPIINTIITNPPTNTNPETGIRTNPNVITIGKGKIPIDTAKEITKESDLDYLPEFPGGIKKFYEYVGANFEKPDLDNVSTIKVLMTFVIEKDGSLTDIKVLRNPGYGLDLEAIRVLKSLKTKWKPGIKDGQKMRTQYMLPITVQMN